MLPPLHPTPALPKSNDLREEARLFICVAPLRWRLVADGDGSNPIQSHLSDAQKPACTRVDSWLAW